MEFTKALSQHSNILHSSVMKQKERELDLLSFYVLFSHCRQCDVTLQIIQVLHYPSAFACRDNGKFSFESLGGLNNSFHVHHTAPCLPQASPKFCITIVTISWVLESSPFP